MARLSLSVGRRNMRSCLESTRCSDRSCSGHGVVNIFTTILIDSALGCVSFGCGFDAFLETEVVSCNFYAKTTLG